MWTCCLVAVPLNTKIHNWPNQCKDAFPPTVSLMGLPKPHVSSPTSPYAIAAPPLWLHFELRYVVVTTVATTDSWLLLFSSECKKKKKKTLRLLIMTFYWLPSNMDRGKGEDGIIKDHIKCIGLNTFSNCERILFQSRFFCRSLGTPFVWKCCICDLRPACTQHVTMPA